ncbi:MAG: RfaE bifunctional protein [Candidatus Azambacteria bacterium GW2011_GWB1_42_17]|uniref:RfaE bifunctional protein n=1 Tax=Candidatus Azambacteria bacterium GW2011_GWB1_42_17 TaxID=1618615 RepID=A0A0G0Z7V6_9BACT|nr:MAG: RfaE bifunctional protein [Candidatus Azambacteria bacterium GW2011_GWB1_42_17]
MNSKKLVQIVDKFSSTKLIVLGDLMIDRFIFGSVSRISPEAPVPIVNVHKKMSMPGGAGNVVNNLVALGGSVSVYGIVGKDQTGQELLKMFTKNNVDIKGTSVEPNRETIQKTRIIAQNQHVVRVDEESYNVITSDQEDTIIKDLNIEINKFDAIIVSDYGKGFLTYTLAQKIVKLGINYHKIVIVDTKPDHARWFNGCYLLTPNLKEAREISGLDEINDIGREIQKICGCKNVLITQGAEGMTLFEGLNIDHFPTKAREVYDVSGAGDTVEASIGIALAAGASLKEAVEIANHAAGIVVGKIGTATVSSKELKQDLNSQTKQNDK